MKLKPKITIADHFEVIEDPRIERTKRHKLIDILTIAICAVICGAEGWKDMEIYGCVKYDWLKTFLELPYGIPSHDTFGRVFARIKPEEFQKCFVNWMKSIQKITESINFGFWILDFRLKRRIREEAGQNGGSCSVLFSIQNLKSKI